MKFIWTSIMRRKKLIQFLFCIFLVSMVVGILFYFKQSDINKNSIANSMEFFKANLEAKSINNILSHIIILTLLGVASFLLIGLPAVIIYLFYEGFSIGFSIAVFSVTYGFKGFLFSLVFNLVVKLGFIFLLILFGIKIIDIGRNVIGTFIYSKDSMLRTTLIFNIKKLIALIILFLLNDIFLYFLGSRLVCLFIFLIS